MTCMVNSTALLLRKIDNNETVELFMEDANTTLLGGIQIETKIETNLTGSCARNKTSKGKAIVNDYGVSFLRI